MMNAPAATAAEGSTLTKPADWAIYMVTAALKCASDDKLAATYISHDEAKYSVLGILNWYEAHDEYEWPDFTRLRFDFSQVMRLRRALVQDVLNALEQAGYVKVAVADACRGRLLDSETGRRINSRKRLCKQEGDADKDTIPVRSEEHDQTQGLLLGVMNQLLSRSKCDLSEYLNMDSATRNANQLADVLHDRLVAAWDKPLREDSAVYEELKQKAEAWDRHQRSVPPRSTQCERTATLGASPTAAQEVPSPATVRKLTAGPPPAPEASWDFHQRGFTTANGSARNWEDTHTAP